MPARSWIEIEDSLFVRFVLEEGFISAHYFGVLPQTAADPSPEVDDALNSFGGEERVAEDLFGGLADAVNPARPLDEADDGPRQVEIDDYGTVLEVLALAQDIGGDHEFRSSRSEVTASRFWLLTGLKR